MPRFSIVVPSFNHNSLLARTLDNLAEQTESVECTVVNAGNLGGAYDIFQRPPLPCHIVHRPEATIAQCLNLGLQASSSEWVGFLYAGETYHEKTLEYVAQYFEENPSIDIVYGHADQLDGPNELRGRFPLLHPTFRNLGRRECLTASSVFYRRRLFEHVGAFDESLVSWPHYDLWVRLKKRGIEFGYIKQTLSTVLGNSAVRAFVDSRKFLSPKNIDELMTIARTQLGNVSASRGLYYARWLVNAEGVNRDGSIKYDRRVIARALQFVKGPQTEEVEPRHWTRTLLPVLLHHCSAELKQIIKRPRHLTRFAPRRQRNLLQNAFGRRIFRLKMDEPHVCRLPRKYLKTKLPSVVPTISVITPNLNQGPFIERTILSVLEQQYPKTEYIVQDGCSSDESLSVIKRYDAQIASWSSVKDKGQSQAINFGMKRSHGDIMAYLNSDDVLLPGSLHFVANFFSNNPDIDVVYGDRLLIDEQDQVINYWVLPKHDDATLHWADYVPQETMFWRRSAWDKVGGCIDESFHFAMDWDLILRFQAAGLKFAHVPRFLGAFRITDGQKTNQLLQTSGLREMNRLRERVLGFVPEEPQVTRQVRGYIRKQWYANAKYEIQQYFRKHTDGLISWPPASWAALSAATLPAADADQTRAA